MRVEEAIRKGLPASDEAYNSLEYATVDGEELDSITEGMEIIGAEPVDYPLTDGVVLYLKAKDGTIKALDIGMDLYDTALGEEENPFYIRVATLPANKG